MTISTELQTNINTACARMADLNAQSSRLQDVLNALANAGKDETDVQQKLDALDAAENEAMTAWAAVGAKGKSPALDHDARQALTRELAEAKARARAAKHAAASVDGDRQELNRKLAEAGATLKVAAMAALASHAEEYGERYRQALIDVERHRIFLFALDKLLAKLQDTNDHRTTAFLPQLAKHIGQRDLFIEKVRNEATAEASEHWARLFNSFLRPTPAQPAKAAA